MELNQTRIEDAIIAEVAGKLIGDDNLYERAKRAFDERVDRLWKDVAETRIRSAIELAITDGLEREYCKIDSFGTQKGEKTTIRAELEKLIGGYWNTTVDKQGKPSSGYGNTLTRAEWMMTQLVASDFQGEMKQHVINLGGSLKDKLRGELHETVNRLLSETFNVKSADDQARGRQDRSIIHPPQKAPA